jgi:hypothetical protein
MLRAARHRHWLRVAVLLVFQYFEKSGKIHGSGWFAVRKRANGNIGDVFKQILCCLEACSGFLPEK